MTPRNKGVVLAGPGARGRPKTTSGFVRVTVRMDPKLRDKIDKYAGKDKRNEWIQLELARRIRLLEKTDGTAEKSTVFGSAVAYQPGADLDV